MKYIAGELLQKPKTILEKTIIMTAIAVLSLSGLFGFVASVAAIDEPTGLLIENVSPATLDLLEYQAGSSSALDFIPFSADITAPSEKEIDSVRFHLAPQSTTGTTDSRSRTINSDDAIGDTYASQFIVERFESVAERDSFDGTYRLHIEIFYEDGSEEAQDIANHLAFLPEISNVSPATDAVVEFDEDDEIVFSADISNIFDKAGEDDDFEVQFRHREPGSGGSASSSFGSIVMRDGDTFSRTYSKAELSQYDDGREFEFYVSVVDRRTGIAGSPSIANQTSTGLTLKQEIATGPVENITQDAYYDTIQEAIDEAETGNTIEVSEGTYPENLNVSVEGLSLVSVENHKAIVEGNLKIDGANNVKVQGFTFNSTTDISSERGILSNSDNLYIKNNKFSGYATAITLQIAGGTPSDVDIEGNTFNDNWTGIGSTEDVTGLNIDGNIFTNNINSIGLGAGVELSENETIAKLFENNDLRFNDGDANVSNISDRREGDVVRYGEVDYLLVFHNMVIQAAINVAKTNDTIEVFEGTYNEDVILDVEGLTLKGPNAGTSGYDSDRGDEAIINSLEIGQKSGSGAPANGAVVKGFEISTNAGPGEGNGTAIGSNSHNIVVEDNVIKNFRTGFTSGLASNNVEDITFTLKNNLFENHVSAISTEGAYEAIIEDNKFYNNRNAIGYNEKTNKSNIENNHFLIDDVDEIEEAFDHPAMYITVRGELLGSEQDLIQANDFSPIAGITEFDDLNIIAPEGSLLEPRVDFTGPEVSDVELNGEPVSVARNSNCGSTDFNLVSGEVDFSAVIEDDMSGVSSAYYRVREINSNGCTASNIFDRTNLQDEEDNTQDSWQVSGTFDTEQIENDGMYTVMIVAKDNAGNQTESYIDLLVDNTSPRFRNIDISPVYNNYFTSGELNVNFEIHEANGVDWDANRTRVVLRDDSGDQRVDVDLDKDICPEEANGVYECDVVIDTNEVDDGNYRVTIQARDLAGNFRSTVQFSGNTLIVDNTAPIANLEINGPDADGLVTVTGSAIEDNIRNHWFEITRPDGTRFYEFDFNTTDNSYSFTIDTLKKQNGEYQVRYAATDRAGNRSDDPSFTNPTIDSFVVDNTIASRVANNEDLSMLLQALIEADLVSIFADTSAEADQFTVFAPVDSAFAQLLGELGIDAADLLASPNLAGILTYHAVAGVFESGDLTDGQVIKTLEGTELTVEIDSSDNVFIVDEAGNQAQVVEADVQASNGVVHLIDAVLQFALEEEVQDDEGDAADDPEVTTDDEGAVDEAPTGADAAGVVAAAVGGGLVEAGAPVALGAADPDAAGAAVEEAADEEVEDGETLGDATTADDEDENGEVAGAVDEADEAGWFNWAWALLAAAGLATLWLLAAARRRREEE